VAAIGVALALNGHGGFQIEQSPAYMPTIPPANGQGGKVDQHAASEWGTYGCEGQGYNQQHTPRPIAAGNTSITTLNQPFDVHDGHCWIATYGWGHQHDGPDQIASRPKAIRGPAELGFQVNGVNGQAPVSMRGSNEAGA